jgi:glycosyltransferase involved in cell wall biosynthesis
MPEVSPTVSIIAIFYNLQDYVESCVTSILTYELLKNFAEDSRVSVFKKENGGPGSARNFGLQKATGEWIMFVDGDDLLSPYALSCMISAACKYDCDLVVANPVVVKEGTKVDDVSFSSDIDSTYYDCAGSIECLLYEEVTESPWSKLIKRSLIASHPFPVGVWYEDVYIAGTLFSDVSGMVLLGLPVYGYVMRSGSITHKRKPTMLQARDFNCAISNMISPLKGYASQSAISYRYALEYMRLHALLNVVKDPAANRMNIDIVKLAKENIALCIKDSRIPIAAKVRLSVFRFSPIIHDLMMQAYEFLFK